MNREINPLFFVVAGILALGMLVFVFYRVSSPPTPPAGSYTPGVPPWMEKNGGQTQPGVRPVPSTAQAPQAPQGR